jgi:predicted molibdopterin-dependent oxidoreductase YjgC
VRAASAPPGQARPDWWVFRELAARMGQHWPADSAQRIWDDEVAVLAPQLCGVTYARLEGDGLQWPCPDETHPGTCFLHKDGQFTCGLGIFNVTDWTPPAEVFPCRGLACLRSGVVPRGRRQMVRHAAASQRLLIATLNNLYLPITTHTP